jgi:hypothetical protein
MRERKSNNGRTKDRCIGVAANKTEKVSSKNERLAKLRPWQCSQDTYALISYIRCRSLLVLNRTQKLQRKVRLNKNKNIL